MTLRLALAVLWLLHWLPLPVIARLGDLLGEVVYRLARERRRVTLVNLALCFPQWPESRRVALARAHFRAFASAILAQGVGWFASLERLRRVVRLEEVTWLQQALAEGPVILMTPHFFGLDLAGILISADVDVITINTSLKNHRLDARFRALRRRWNRGTIFTRQDGIRPVLRALKPGWALYYMPDQDFGERESVFADFFGVPAATSPALSRLVRLSGARVVPCVIHQDFRAGCCRVRFHPPWTDFPGTDDLADARRMNRFIETCVQEQPANYLWSHKRFKTRPGGAPSPYGRAPENTLG